MTIASYPAPITVGLVNIGVVEAAGTTVQPRRMSLCDRFSPQPLSAASSDVSFFLSGDPRAREQTSYWLALRQAVEYDIHGLQNCILNRDLRYKDYAVAVALRQILAMGLRKCKEVTFSPSSLLHSVVAVDCGNGSEENSKEPLRLELRAVAGELRQRMHEVQLERYIHDVRMQIGALRAWEFGFGFDIQNTSGLPVHLTEDASQHATSKPFVSPTLRPDHAQPVTDGSERFIDEVERCARWLGRLHSCRNNGEQNLRRES